MFQGKSTNDDNNMYKSIYFKQTEDTTFLAYSVREVLMSSKKRVQ